MKTIYVRPLYITKGQVVIVPATEFDAKANPTAGVTCVVVEAAGDAGIVENDQNERVLVFLDQMRIIKEVNE